MGDIEAQPEDLTDDARGQADRWRTEFDSAKKERKEWVDRGRKIVDRFLDKRKDGSTSKDTRWNMYTSNVQTQQAMLFGRTPGIDVTRRFADAKDDLSRVAAEIHKRILNSDIERDDDTFAQAAQYALSDWLLPGFGMQRYRYVMESDEATGERTWEDVETDYVPWEDVLWSPCKVFHMARWFAFRSLMGRKALKKRFEKHGENIPLNHNKKEGEPESPWGRAEVWEIWDKDNRERVFYVEGFHEVLETTPDPLKLNGFWPFQRPLMANITTSKMIPTPDFVLVQDLYDEIDLLASRAMILEKAIRVTGGYDESCKGIQDILSDNAQNVLYPIENFAEIRDKGGLESVVFFMPLEPIVAALAAIQQRQDRLVEAVFQLTGMSDIMRGQAQTPNVTAAEQTMKAKFGSVRIQSKQDEFARFCSEGQRIRGEIIVKMFDTPTLLARANVDSMPEADKAIAPQAIELLKSKYRDLKIEVKPESVSMTDFAALKQERMEALSTIGGFLGMAGGLVQQVPGSLPHVLEILQTLLAGLKGSGPIESILDQAIQAAKQAAENPQPQQEDPAAQTERLKQQTEQMKAQMELQTIQAKTQAKIMEISAETQAKSMMERVQREENTREARDKALIAQATRPDPKPAARGPSR